MDKNSFFQKFLQKYITHLEMLENTNFMPINTYINLKNTFDIANQLSRSMTYKIIVTGLKNSGKSSLVNCLINKSILLTNSFEKNQWPIIIRHHDEECSKLFSSQLSSTNYYNLIPKDLLAEGDENVRQKLVELQNSSDLAENYRKFKLLKTNQNISKDEENYSLDDTLTNYSKNEDVIISEFSNDSHNQFIFILFLNLFDSIEIWDLPSSNSNSEMNFLNEIIFNNIITNESNINKTFPYIDSKRLFLISVTECSNLNSLENKIYVDNLKVINRFCNKSFYIINKIDQLKSDNLTLLKSKEFDLKYFFISSLYSYIENKEKNNVLDKEYWSLKENIYETVVDLRKQYKSFDNYKESIKIEDLKDNLEFCDNMKNFKEELVNSLKINKFLDFLYKNPKKMYSDLIFDNESLLINNPMSYSISYDNRIFVEKYTNEFSNDNLKNINNIFSFYFDKLNQHIKFGLKISKSKIQKEVENTRKNLDDIICSISIYNKDKFSQISNIYQDLIKTIENLKNEYMSHIKKYNLNLIIKIKKELTRIGIKSSIIEYFIKKVNTEVSTEMSKFEENFEIKGNCLLEDLSLAISSGILKGTVAFLGTNLIHAILSSKSAAVGLISSTVFCFIIAISCVIYSSYKQFKDVNSENKELFLNSEKELWKKIDNYREEIFQVLKNYAISTKNNMMACKYKINEFFSFLSL